MGSSVSNSQGRLLVQGAHSPRIMACLMLSHFPGNISLISPGKRTPLTRWTIAFFVGISDCVKKSVVAEKYLSVIGDFHRERCSGDRLYMFLVNKVSYRHTGVEHVVLK